MIKAKNISFHVGEKQILNDISVSVHSGEIMAILGPNGAGKSTLLKVLTGSLIPKCGQVLLNDTPLSHYSIHQLSKRRAVLSQSNPITFPFSAYEIVMMGRSPYLADKEAHHDHQIVDDILMKLDALHLKERLFSTLSGGEQQRIQFARILAQIWEQKDAYLFLDEPTSALDLKQQLIIVELVKGLAKSRGYGVCMILHDLNLAKHYADQIILLKNGRIASYGTCEEVLTAKKIAMTFDIPNDYAKKYVMSQ